MGKQRENDTRASRLAEREAARALPTRPHEHLGFAVDLIKIVEEVVQTYGRLGDLGRSVAINSPLHSDLLTTFKC